VPGSRAAPFWRFLRGRTFGASDAIGIGRIPAVPKGTWREWPRGRRGPQVGTAMLS